MIFRPLAATLALLMLTACEGGPQYLVETAPSSLRVNARVSTVLVRTVSLPSYAEDQKIAIEDETGVVRDSKFGLWADEPARAATLRITRNLNTMTNANVAPEPWPMPEPPQGVVDIRVETFIATKTNTFRLAGQYFMGSEIPEAVLDPEDFDKAPRELPPPLPDKARLFDIVIPMPDSTPGSVATAQSAALTALSEAIARDLAR
ncbi:PqiC family protein [Maliponia aquimaris]|uniref:ABC-type transport auxiliary lipoprotein component domain-containing protein n=1 Tax=Maliponia aquimaris TaxID=1673631 RepID=A0A238KZE5_9RHOB|nr:ABC-type transport auxiliary lipoprotein family protein [Maliponia aquimaris]SMX48139.1 hypothetical protein MAA8898_03874 [Maliponia aquimaris]